VSLCNKNALTVNNPGLSGLISLQGDANLLLSTGTFDFSVDQIERTGLITLTGNELILDSVSTDFDLNKMVSLMELSHASATT